ncbi:MAG TPA: alpha/beta hydrolase [Candidatus Caenarcaniphilales bacterium]
MNAPQSRWQHQFIETNHIRLHCVVQGEGDLVLLLHGFPEFWYAWRYQIPVLARHFKVVVPDLRGYNDSDKPDSGYDLDTLSADIRGLIDSLGYRQAHIVGHDHGGIIAWYLAEKFPRYLNRLAVLNAPHPYRFSRELLSHLDRLRQSWYILALQLPGLPEWLIRRNVKTFLENLFPGQAIRKGAFTRETLQIYQAALEKTGVRSAIINYYRQLLSPQAWFGSLSHSPEPVTVPTLVLWGEDDTLLSPRLADGLEQVIQAPFRLKFVPGCGHWIQQEAPKIVNRELLTFLRQALKPNVAASGFPRA